MINPLIVSYPCSPAHRTPPQQRERDRDQDVERLRSASASDHAYCAFLRRVPLRRSLSRRSPPLRALLPSAGVLVRLSPLRIGPFLRSLFRRSNDSVIGVASGCWPPRAFRVTTAFRAADRRLRVTTAFLAVDRRLRVTTAFFADARRLRVATAFFAAARRLRVITAFFAAARFLRVRAAFLPEDSRAIWFLLELGAQCTSVSEEINQVHPYSPLQQQHDRDQVVEQRLKAIKLQQKRLEPLRSGRGGE